jgi:tRNA nucleotidyltransferase/poly(A) polymerase
MKTSVLRDYIQIILQEGSGNLSDEQTDAALDLISSLISSSSQFRGKVYLAGGAVRDELMGKTSHDIDIVVALKDGGIKLAEWLAQRMGTKRGPVTFEKFGTAMLSLDGIEHNGIDLSGVEIETVQTRAEKYDPDSRKPSTSFGTIEQDVMRRDLTINSLLKDLTTGKVLDLTGKGMQDIKDGTVRTPMDPNETFDDDPLRILRAIRFASRYDFHMTDEIKQAMIDNADRLKIISKERIRDELGKILTGTNPEVGMKLLIDHDLVRYVVPELVGKETQITGLRFTSSDLVPNMALLLSLTGDQVMSSAKQLRFSNEEAKQIMALANFRNQMIQDPSSKNILKSSLPVYSSGGGDYAMDVIDDLPSKRDAEALNEFLGVEPTLFFPGGDLLKAFDLKPGPQIGEIIKLQQEMWYENPAVTQADVRSKIENYLS